jgi:hypothetical protein
MVKSFKIDRAQVPDEFENFECGDTSPPFL